MYIETENFVPPGLYAPGIRYLTNKHKTEGRVYHFYKAAVTKHQLTTPKSRRKQHYEPSDRCRVESVLPLS